MIIKVTLTMEICDRYNDNRDKIAINFDGQQLQKTNH